MSDHVESSVRFEPCPSFRGADDPLVCACGWLEDDHTGHPPAPVVRIADRRRARGAVPVRRAS